MATKEQAQRVINRIKTWVAYLEVDNSNEDDKDRVGLMHSDMARVESDFRELRLLIGEDPNG